MQLIDSLSDVADQFDAIVLDQWGVLHDGTRPYPKAVQTLEGLRARGVRLSVLSNSGKRSDLNTQRIADMGFDAALFDVVMTSGEALWRDCEAGHVSGTSAFVICENATDAKAWGAGLNLRFVDAIEDAEFVILMGRPVFGDLDAEAAWLADLEAKIKARGLRVYCTNPDRASPRAGGRVVPSPGAIAHAWADLGFDVTFYGKPHTPVFRAVEMALNVAPDRLLMVGDSLEHDIAGGVASGWSTAFIRGGLHAAHFAPSGDTAARLEQLAAQDSAPMPTFSLSYLE